MKLVKIRLLPRAVYKMVGGPDYVRVDNYIPKSFPVRIPIAHFKNSWPDFRRNSKNVSIKNEELVVLFDNDHFLPLRSILDGTTPWNALKWKYKRFYPYLPPYSQYENLDGTING